MAVAEQISPAIKAENDARDDLRHAIAMAFLSNAGHPMTMDGINEMLNALDRYIEAKLQPRRY